MSTIDHEADGLIVSMVQELEQRETDALRLYRPRNEEIDGFHRSSAAERIVRGGKGSGKSCAGYAELASAATGIPIIGLDGKPIARGYPEPPLLIWSIGYGWDHIGDTVYRYLCTEDHGMRMITDEATGQWRIYRPWEDEHREKESRKMGPLIPKRMIEMVGWENTRLNQFSIIRLTNGTTIRAFVSTAERAKMGDEPNLIDVDEDVKYPAHVEEWLSRLRKGGRFTWNAHPWTHNEALRGISQRADEQKGEKNPDVEEFRLRFSENRFIHEKERRKMIRRWSDMGDDILRSNDEGEYMMDSVMMYPSWSEDVHGISLSSPGPNEKNMWIRLLAESLRENNGAPPSNWRKDLIIDPGHTVCAVLASAVPPPHMFGNKNFIIIYDELYLKRKNASEVANAIVNKFSGQTFQKFIIDEHASRITGIGLGAGENVYRIYSQAFEAHNLRSIETGSGFAFGPDNVVGGCAAVRESMHVRGDGTPKLLTVLDTTPFWQYERRNYKKTIVRSESGEPQEKPCGRQADHTMDCMRYLVLSDPQWRQPEMSKVDPGPAYREFMELVNPKKDPMEDEEQVHLGSIG